MVIELPDNIINTGKVSQEELQEELAVFFYERDYMTLQEASEFCHLDTFEFQKRVSDISFRDQFDLDDIESDFRTISEFDM
jgi:predicted HTH domain antitoxin